MPGHSDLDEIKKRYKRLQEEEPEGGIVWMRLKVGPNVIRILPPKSSKVFYVETAYHQNIPDAQTGEAGNEPCRKVIGESCPLCDLGKELRKSKNQAEVDFADYFYPPRKAFYFNVLDKSDSKVKVLRAGVMIMKDIFKYFSSDEWGNLDHPIKGVDINIERVGTTRDDTEYAVVPKRESTPLASTEEEIQRIIDSQFDISVLAKFPSLEESEKAVSRLIGHEIPEVEKNKEKPKPKIELPLKREVAREEEPKKEVEKENAEAKVNLSVKEALARLRKT
jgi:hypothetical protein